MKKIGIFAGTFDPIHEGHIAFAHAALEAGLEKVMFLVEPRPRRKQGVRALEHRIAMVQLAIQNETKMGTIVLEQARFTPHETLPALQARFASYKLVLLFGDDVMAHIAHWPHVEELVASVELLIASRQAKTEDLAMTFKILKQTRGLTFRYQVVQPERQQVSSSAIRLNLKRRQPAKGLAPAVAAYIHSHRLYASAAASK